MVDQIKIKGCNLLTSNHVSHSFLALPNHIDKPFLHTSTILIFHYITVHGINENLVFRNFVHMRQLVIGIMAPSM